MLRPDLTAAMTTELAKATGQKMAWLITLGFSTPRYMTTWSNDLEWDGITYVADDDLVSIGNMKETVTLSASTTNIVLSGANRGNIQTALTEQYNNLPVTIHMALLDDLDKVIPDPMLNAMKGRMDGFTLSENPRTGVSTVKWKVISSEKGLDKVNGRMTNIANQQSIFPADEGMEFVEQSMSDIRWGGTG